MKTFLIILFASLTLKAQYYSDYTGGFIDTTILNVNSNFQFDNDTLGILKTKIWQRESDFRNWYKANWYLEDAYAQSDNFFSSNAISAWASTVFSTVLDDNHKTYLSSAYYGLNNIGVFSYMGGDTLFPAQNFINKVRLNPDAGAVLRTSGGTALYLNSNRLEIQGNNLPTTYTDIIGNETYFQEFSTTGDVNLTTTDFYGFRFRNGGSSLHRYSFRYIYGYYSNMSDNNFASHVYTNAFHFYGKGNYPSWFGGSVNALGFNYFSDAQASDAYVVTLAGAHTLVAGLEITFKANTANTDGATVNVNGLGAKALTKCASGSVATALATGDIIAGQIVKAVYDGTQFQVISRLAQ